MEIPAVERWGSQLRDPALDSGSSDYRQLIQAAKAVNSARALGDHTEIAFSIDHTTHLPVFKIIDRNTQKVVDQVPPEYILRLAENLGKRSA